MCGWYQKSSSTGTPTTPFQWGNWGNDLSNVKFSSSPGSKSGWLYITSALDFEVNNRETIQICKHCPLQIRLCAVLIHPHRVQEMPTRQHPCQKWTLTRGWHNSLLSGHLPEFAIQYVYSVYKYSTMSTFFRKRNNHLNVKQWKHYLEKITSTANIET